MELVQDHVEWRGFILSMLNLRVLKLSKLVTCI